MLDFLTLYTKTDAIPHLFLIKPTEAILLKCDWLYFLTDMSINVFLEKCHQFVICGISRESDKDLGALIQLKHSK